MFKDYYKLAKPGIVYGNLLSAIAAYAYASRWNIGSSIFVATIVGLGFIIASAAVFNNYFDRDIDIKMERTRDRALATGVISKINALIFGCILGILGFAILLLFTYLLTTFVALIGFLVYVFAYTFAKRKTYWATEIGSIAGAVPIVVGYTAAVDRLDGAALILFLTLALWQMPHFYAIALRRSEEYAAAGIPILPLQKGIWATKNCILLYIAAFAIMASFLTIFGYAGYSYMVVVALASLAWFALAAQGFNVENEEAWARKLFFASLIVLVVFCLVLSVATILP